MSTGNDQDSKNGSGREEKSKVIDKKKIKSSTPKPEDDEGSKSGSKRGVSSEESSPMSVPMQPLKKRMRVGPGKQEEKSRNKLEGNSNDFLEFIGAIQKETDSQDEDKKQQQRKGTPDPTARDKKKVVVGPKKNLPKKKTDSAALAAAAAVRNGLGAVSDTQDLKSSMATMQSRDLQELLQLNGLRQQVLSQSAPDDTAALLRRNGLNNFVGPTESSLASASELRELQLQNEFRQHLLSQSQQASQFQASDLLQNNYAMQNLSALSLLQQQQQQQQQQQKELADYLQLLNGGNYTSSLAAAAAASNPGAAGLAGLSQQDVDNAMLRATLAQQNSLAAANDPELLLRLSSLRNGGVGATDQLSSQLQLLSGRNAAAGGLVGGDDMTANGRDALSSALSQYPGSQASALLRLGETLPGAMNGLSSSLTPASSFMPSLGAAGGSSGIPGGLAALNPELRAALMQDGGVSSNLLQNLGQYGM